MIPTDEVGSAGIINLSLARQPACSLSPNMPDSNFDSKPFTRELVKDHFGNTIYHRGLNYFREGRVFDRRIDEDGTIRAKVRGGDFAPYRVVLHPARGL